MADEIIRKTVKPAHDGACIPDPAHPGLDIAQDGTDVIWDHHWMGRLARGEIVVMKPEEVEKIARAKDEAALKAKADREKATAAQAKAAEPVAPARAAPAAPAAATGA